MDSLEQRDERYRTKVINGTSYTVRCTDPYGFWAVDAPAGKGPLPMSLRSNFTSLSAVWEAINAEENKKKAKEAKPVLMHTTSGVKGVASVLVPVTATEEEMQVLRDKAVKKRKGL